MLPIAPETSHPFVHGIVLRGAVGGLRVTEVEIFAVDTVATVRASLTITQRTDRLAIAAARCEKAALRISRRERDDVDDAIHRVYAPKRSARTADDFDAVDILEQYILNIPEDTGEKRGVNRPAVDQHEQLIGRGVAEAPRADRVRAGAHLYDVQGRRQTQRL